MRDACGVALFGALVCAGPTRAVEPYAALEVGAYTWPAFSNRNQIEADTLPGLSVSLAGGVEFLARDFLSEANTRPGSFLDRLGGRIELAASQRISAIHGVNDDAGQRTADGKTLYATTGLVNGWASWALSDRVRIYGGGGLGMSWIKALGSDATVFSSQSGAGVRFRWPIGSASLDLDLGWRSLWSSSVQLDRGRIDFDAHGGVIGLSIRR